MFPILQVGPLSIQMPGLILLIGIWIGLSLSERFAKKFKSDPEEISNLLFYGLVFALIGARLSFALRFPSAFSSNPTSLLSLNPGLLDPWGAALGFLLSALVYGQRKKMSFAPTLDALTPAIGSLIVAISVSNLASGQGFGQPTEMPWAINLWGAMRHPTQWYEIIVSAALLFVLLRFRMSHLSKSGSFFVEFIALSTTTRLYLEAFRGDSILLPNGWRLVQILAWALLALSLIAYYQINKESFSA